MKEIMMMMTNTRMCGVTPTRMKTMIRNMMITKTKDQAVAICAGSMTMKITMMKVRRDNMMMKMTATSNKVAITEISNIHVVDLVAIVDKRDNNVDLLVVE